MPQVKNIIISNNNYIHADRRPNLLQNGDEHVAVSSV